jgi:hypothetical protein
MTVARDVICWPKRAYQKRNLLLPFILGGWIYVSEI